MNSTTPNFSSRPNQLVALAVAALILAACATAPVKPTGADDARAKLTRLESNPDLSTRAPEALKEAEAAVAVAEIPQTDPEFARSNVYLADRKVDIAMARAQTKLLEDQRTVLAQQRDQARLDARTREVDAANLSAANSRAEAGAANTAAANSQAEAGAANLAAANSQASAAELQKQLDDLHGKATDHGMVITLGDVLFASGMAQLRSAIVPNLDHLVVFLNHYPDRSIVIDGYTDNVGTADYNLGLSQRRANSVKSYLTQGGINGTRITANGMGLSDPVASNESSDGRQQNRRVEVTISDPPAAAR